MKHIQRKFKVLYPVLKQEDESLVLKVSPNEFVYVTPKEELVTYLPFEIKDVIDAKYNYLKQVKEATKSEKYDFILRDFDIDDYLWLHVKVLGIENIVNINFSWASYDVSMRYQSKLNDISPLYSVVLNSCDFIQINNSYLVPNLASIMLTDQTYSFLKNCCLCIDHSDQHIIIRYSDYSIYDKIQQLKQYLEDKTSFRVDTIRD